MGDFEQPSRTPSSSSQVYCSRITSEYPLYRIFLFFIFQFSFLLRAMILPMNVKRCTSYTADSDYWCVCVCARARMRTSWPKTNFFMNASQIEETAPLNLSAYLFHFSDITMTPLFTRVPSKGRVLAETIARRDDFAGLLARAKCSYCLHRIWTPLST